MGDSGVYSDGSPCAVVVAAAFADGRDAGGSVGGRGVAEGRGAFGGYVIVVVLECTASWWLW